MKNNILTLALILAALTIILQSSSPRKKKKVENRFVPIPAGQCSLKDKTIEVKAFWCSEYEISNKQYRTFLNWLKTEQKEEWLKIAQIDSLKWRKDNGYNEPYVEYYHKHPAYDNYPVVNISKEGAQLYCQWLTETINDGFIYRLPTKEEWIYAAKGGLNLVSYPWGGPYLRNNKGMYQCNFLHLGDENIHVNNGAPYCESEKKDIQIAPETSRFSGVLNDHADITAPINSYWGNGYGLFNCSGNVAEMVADYDVAMGGSWAHTGYDVRIQSEMTFTEANPYVGFRPIKVKK